MCLLCLLSFLISYMVLTNGRLGKAQIIFFGGRAIKVWLPPPQTFVAQNNFFYHFFIDWKWFKMDRKCIKNFIIFILFL